MMVNTGYRCIIMLNNSLSGEHVGKHQALNEDLRVTPELATDAGLNPPE